MIKILSSLFFMFACTIASSTATAEIQVLVVDGDPAPVAGKIFAISPTAETVLREDGSVVSSSFFPESPFARALVYEADLAGTRAIAVNGESFAGGFNLLDPGTRANDITFGGSGQVFFHAEYDGPGVLSSEYNGLFTSTASSGITPIAISGSTTAAGNGVLSQSGLTELVANSNGQAAFSASLFDVTNSPSNDRGLYRWDGSGVPIVEIAREGDLLPDGRVMSALQTTPKINGDGDVAFNTGSGVYRSDGSTAVTIATLGQPAPGGGAFDGGRSQVELNDAGDVSFVSVIEFAGGQVNPQAIFVGDENSLSRYVRTQEATPDGNENYRNFFPELALNNQNQVVFAARTSGGSGSLDGIYRADGPNDITQVAARRQLVLDDQAGIVSLGSYSINDSGQVAFRAQLDFTPEDGIGVSGVPGLFLYDDNLGLVEVARAGMPLLGSSIERITFTGTSAGSLENNDSRRDGLNNAGQVSFAFELANGIDGIAVWSPELTGDYNADGFVSQADLDLVLLNWGDSSIPAEWVAAAQFDGVLVSQNELDGVLLNWGDGTPPSVAIPEPASLTILAGTLAITRRRRR